VTAGRAGGLRLLGVPVRLDPSVIIVLLILGASAHTTMAALVAFLAGGAVALVAHELGHAVVARAFGATDVTITLHSFGGLTSYRLASATRTRLSAIAFAGPAVGLVLGLFVWLAERATAPAAYSDGAQVYDQLLFVTVGWSALNLLPVVPLDGGRLLEQVLPGTPRTRARAAGLISTVVGLGMALWFWRRGYGFAAVMFCILAGYALMAAVRRESTDERPPPPATDRVFVHVVVGDYAGALDAARSATDVDPAVSALLAVVTTDDAGAAEQLRRLYTERPNDPLVRGCVAIAMAHGRDWQGVIGMIDAGDVRPGTGFAALRIAYEAGAFTAGAGVGEAVLRAEDDPVVAFNTARCWARTGNDELALSALKRAVAYGWTDRQAMDRDEDLASVRATEGYRSWRTTLPAPA
jgi:Zn-dependent protease